MYFPCLLQHMYYLFFVILSIFLSMESTLAKKNSYKFFFHNLGYFYQFFYFIFFVTFFPVMLLGLKGIRHLKYFYFLSLDLPYNFFMFSTFMQKGFVVF